jgi:hypothetical protein
MQTLATLVVHGIGRGLGRASTGAVSSSGSGRVDWLDPQPSWMAVTQVWGRPGEQPVYRLKAVTTLEFCTYQFMHLHTAQEVGVAIVSSHRRRN